MTNPRVLCIGEILFDCLADRPGQALEQVESWTPYPGGAPANVACALTKWGTPAAFIGCVGEDEPGKQLTQLLEEVGVDPRGIQYHSSAPTRQVYVLRTEKNDRVFAGFGDRAADEFADAFLDPDRLPVSLFEKADFLVMGTLELAYPLSRKAIFRALQLAEQGNVKVVLDANWRPMFWRDEREAKPLIQDLYKRVDFLKLSKEEAQWLFDTSEAGAIAYRLNSVEGVLITDGEHQVGYCINDKEGKVSPYPVDVRDTTGSGDGFVAGFVHQLSSQGMGCLDDAKTVRDIVNYACAVGGLIATRPGAIASQPTAAEVESFLQQMQG